MKRSELEHVVRASAAISGEREIFVIGSQSILGQFPGAPDELLVSRELDVFTNDPTKAELIDGSIGERSPFHETFGYYAHGVAEETATLPAGWKDRLVRVENENTGGAVGLCLEAHDLAVSKLVAGREKDLDFVAGMFRHRMVKPEVVLERLSSVSMGQQQMELVVTRLRRIRGGK
jgi:hypothetical protein